MDLGQAVSTCLGTLGLWQDFARPDLEAIFAQATTAVLRAKAQRAQSTSQVLQASLDGEGGEDQEDEMPGPMHDSLPVSVTVASICMMARKRKPRAVAVGDDVADEGVGVDAWCSV